MTTIKDLPVPAPTLGLAALTRIIQDKDQLTPVWDGLIARATGDEVDAGALLDLSTLLQLSGDPEKAAELQSAAIGVQPYYRKAHGDGQGLRILAFMTAGDLMANTPIDFLLEGSNAVLTTYYLDGPPPSPEAVPDHDVAFLAIGHSEDGSRTLTPLVGAFDTWPKPVVNGRPDLIAALTRDGVAARFANHPQVLCPPTARIERAALEAVVRGQTMPGGLAFPIIVRPLASHAGRGLEKMTSATELAAYLAARDELEFYVSAFVDYSGPDRLFRKLRVVCINGRPFISHMAVSPRWMVHYLNADMAESPANRAEEATMMATFDEGFATRHIDAFAALAACLGLDYFGIDCAETRDGRLLVFEADVAMIVHAMDPVDLYAYKRPAMAKLFDAFLSALSAA